MDQSGHVVAVYTLGYRPFGGQAGDGQAIAVRHDPAVMLG